jgi:hypothetical protein
MTKPKMTMKHQAFEQYEMAMTAVRARFARESALATKMLDPQIERDALELCLIHYHGLGYKMTEPVEDWMRRGGERCRELGLEEIGKGLCRHAAQESGHHLLMLADAQALTARWMARTSGMSDAKASILWLRCVSFVSTAANCSFISKRVSAISL